MAEFYPPEATELSRRVLGQVVDAVPDAVLIGGWGSWVRTGGAMSHDIDLILDRSSMARLESLVDDFSESRHLAGRKWRATWKGIHLDLYVPYQSTLGRRLELRTEKLLEYAEPVDRWRLLSVDGQIATKLAALLDRPDSLPGEKDRDELRRLLHAGGGGGTPDVLLQASARSPGDLAAMVAEAFGYLGESAGLDRARRDRLRRTAKSWVARIGA